LIQRSSWLGRQRVSLKDKNREQPSKEKINSKDLKRVRISSSNRVIDMAVGITKKEIVKELETLAASALIIGSEGLSQEITKLKDKINKDL